MSVASVLRVGGWVLPVGLCLSGCSPAPDLGAQEEVAKARSEVPAAVQVTAARLAERVGGTLSDEWFWDTESEDWECAVVGLPRRAEIDVLPDGRFSELELVYTRAEVQAALPDAAAFIDHECREDPKVVIELSLRREQLLDPLPTLAEAWDMSGVVIEFQCPNGRDFEFDARFEGFEHRIDDVGEQRRVAHDGFSLHAGVCVTGTDREGLERLCRYVARPAIATERLSELPDGRIAYDLRHPWSDGTTRVVFEPLNFLEKLAALIPPPRAHLVTYHGVLAPASAMRSRVVPGPSAARRSRSGSNSSGGAARRYPWAELLKRVFAVDALSCHRCGGRREVLALITEGSVVRAILECLGLPAEGPVVHPARGPPGLF